MRKNGKRVRYLVGHDRVHEGAKWAEVATEEARDVERRAQESKKSSKLNEDNVAPVGDDVGLPQSQPGQVGEKCTRGRDHRKVAVREQLPRLRATVMQMHRRYVRPRGSMWDRQNAGIRLARPRQVRYL